MNPNAKPGLEDSSAALSASGAARLMRLLIGAMLGVASGVLTGVITALAYRRLTLTRCPIPGDLAPSR